MYFNDVYMIRAYKIYTGTDGHTHIEKGTVKDNFITEAISIRFKETPAHAFYDWHPAPTTQYVISLKGTLQFTTFHGEEFVLKPGDVLIAMDTTGSGHKWQIIDNDPWYRAYVAFEEGSDLNFIPNNK